MERATRGTLIQKTQRQSRKRSRRAPHMGPITPPNLGGGAKESEGGGPAARGKQVADHGDGDGDDGTASNGLEDAVADQGP